MMTTPVISTVYFMFFAVTGRSDGQNEKNMTTVSYKHANVLTRIPNNPGICHGSQTKRAPFVFSRVSFDSLRGIIAAVLRRYSKRAVAVKYEQFSPVTPRETRSLKAVEETRTMRERRQDMVVVMKIALIGREVRGST